MQSTALLEDSYEWLIQGLTFTCNTIRISFKEDKAQLHELLVIVTANI